MVDEEAAAVHALFVRLPNKLEASFAASITDVPWLLFHDHLLLLLFFLLIVFVVVVLIVEFLLLCRARLAVSDVTTRVVGSFVWDRVEVRLFHRLVVLHGRGRLGDVLHLLFLCAWGLEVAKEDDEGRGALGLWRRENEGLVRCLC